MIKRKATVLFFLALFTFAACTSSTENANEQEAEKVEDYLKSDQEKADSARKALGID